MCSLKHWYLAVASLTVLLVAPAFAQTGAAPASQPAPMQMSSLEQTGRTDPFPPVNPKFFTATTPTVETVNNFLKALWGYDPNRIWRVEAVLATPAPGVSKVVVAVSDKSPNAKVQSTSFFVTPDGAHAIAGEGVVPFGNAPFAPVRRLLAEKADGPSTGAASKDLELVEFADLQCPHCKEGQTTMDQLAKDFPGAHIVYQPYPLVDIHPFAFKAATYGYCVAQQKSSAYLDYARAVYDTQGGLTQDSADQTLKDAVVKAGLDAGAIDTCAATQAAKDAVNASIKLGDAAGVDQTPMLVVNGHPLPLTGIPYETLKTLIAFQAQEDGVSAAAVQAPARTAPSLK
ncbi:MAG: DsbA family protein [Acidobacteriota bacterium]|nr:DsbA family protein [Acidobacteriota bacterium]